MRKLSLRLAQLLLICCVGVTMLGADSDTTRFDHLGHQLVCQCGCGQILLECNHVGCPVSGPMMTELHTQMAVPGFTAKTVYAWFINKYGPVVLAAPIRGGFDDVAWIIPIVSFVLATLGVALLIRLWHRRRSVLVPVGSAEAALLPSVHLAAHTQMTDRIRADTDEWEPRR